MLTKRTDAILIIGFLLLGMGIILHVVGLATPAWMYLAGRPKLTYGLFKWCFEGECTGYTTASSDLEAVQALTITGAELAGLALTMSIIFSVTVYKGQTKSKTLVVFTGLGALLAALLIFVGCMVFAVDVYSEGAPGWKLYLDYSFFLCIVASGVIGFSGILIWIGGYRIIASTASRTARVMTPGGAPMVVAYQAPGSGAVFAPSYQATGSSVTQPSAGSTHPPPQSLPQQQSVYPPQQQAGYPPQQHAAYPPQQHAAYPPQQQAGYPPQQQAGYPPQQQTAYPPQHHAAYPPQQFPAAGSVAQPPNQPPAAEKNTT